MDKTRVPRLPSRSLADDDALRDLLLDLLQGAISQRVWLMFVDADQRLADTIMPSDDLPHDPDARVLTDDLGDVSYAHVLAARLPLIMELIDAEQPVLVWEHPGEEGRTDEALAWPRAMAAACLDLGVPLRAQFVLHDRGIRHVSVADF